MRTLLIMLFLALAIAITGCRSGGTATPPPTQPVSTITATSTPTKTTTEPTSSAPGPNPTSPPPVVSPVTPTQSPSPLPPTAQPTAVPAQPAAPTPAGAQPSCTNLAAFYDDITIPDGTFVTQATSFTKTWRVRNEGTCDWDSRYSLVFSGGEAMSAALSSPLENIPAGSTADISIEMTAPLRGGSYISKWEFQSPEGQRFGVGTGGLGPLYTQINIGFIAPTPNPTAAASPPKSTSCRASQNSSFEGQVLQYINQARTAQGLDELALSSQLSAAALAHSTDMACNHFWGHTGSDGSTWYDRASRQGYANFHSARENIYIGSPDYGGDPQGAFNWWMNSQVHRDNILNPSISEIGVGYVFDQASDYGGYFTILFARP